MLTNAAVKAARPRAAAYKLVDQRGLHLYVAPTGLRSFRWRFRIAGREQLLTIGSYPEVTLDQARARCDAARAQLARGEDPRAANDATAAPVNFESVARRWHALMARTRTARHASDVLASLERDVFPAVGAMPIAAVTVPVVLSALRAIEARGSIQTAHRVRQRISMVFSFAIAEDLVDQDPAAVVGRALMAPAPVRNLPALTRIEDARALLASAARAPGADVVKLASRFLALTAVRIAAVLGADWSEIEDLDGDAPLWRIPAARMKLRAAKKLDAKNDHVVPLSPQAVAVLREVRELGHGAGLVFPGGDYAAPIAEKAIGDLYKRAGFGGRHVPHGWRATFSTVMNEAGSDGALIERALAHSPKDKVKAAYDRSQQLLELRRLFAAWADVLDG